MPISKTGRKNLGQARQNFRNYRPEKRQRRMRRANQWMSGYDGKDAVNHRKNLRRGKNRSIVLTLCSTCHRRNLRQAFEPKIF